MGLIKKLRKAKKEAPPNEKPAVVKTHLRDMIVVPEMIGSVVGIYNGKVRLVVSVLDILLLNPTRSSTTLR
jgi:ribosomal protein S19